MILKTVNLSKSSNRKFISRKYSPTYKIHKVYFLWKKINKSPISGRVLLMYFELHREKRSLSRRVTLWANMNPKCFLWKRIKYFTFLYCSIYNLRDSQEVKGVRGSVGGKRWLWEQFGHRNGNLGVHPITAVVYCRQSLSLAHRWTLALQNKQRKMLLMVKNAKFGT